MRRAQMYHPAETEAILRLFKAGATWKQIARAIGRNVDESSIRQHVRRVAPDILVIPQAMHWDTAR